MAPAERGPTEDSTHSVHDPVGTRSTASAAPEHVALQEVRKREGERECKCGNRNSKSGKNLCDLGVLGLQSAQTRAE